MAQIKTVTTTSGTNSIKFDAYYPFVWFKNLGTGDVYVSDNFRAQAGADDTALLKAGEIIRITVQTDTVYVVGATTVEVHAQGFADCPFKKRGKGGEIELTGVNITENGTYTPPSGKAYGRVDVSVITPAVTVPLTVTENGTYTVPTGVDGYSPVTVAVSPYNVDTSYLPNSNTADIVASVVANELANPQELVSIPITSDASYVNLADANSDVTVYAVVKNKADGEGILLCVPYTSSDGNSPSFYSPMSSYAVECTVYGGNTRVSGIACNVYHVYTLAINSASKTVRYYIDGVYLMEKTFTNSGSIAVVGTGDRYGGSYANGRVSLQYMGVVSELESDETIIANQLVIMNKLGLE